VTAIVRNKDVLVRHCRNDLDDDNDDDIDDYCL